MTIFVVIFEDIASKFEKIGPLFKFQSISILAIRSNRPQKKKIVSLPKDSLQ